MSLFSVGGNIGFALGPVLVTPLVIVFGLHGTLFLLIPTWLMAGVLIHELPRLRRFRVDLEGGRVQQSDAHDAWRPFIILGGVIALRSFVYFGFVSFVPLYFIHDLHTSKALGGVALTAMLVGGATGTLLGGRLADRFGRRSVLSGSMLALPSLTIGFLLSAGAGNGVRRGRGRGHHRHVRGHDRHGPGIPARPDRRGLLASPSACRSGSAASARRCSASSPMPTGCVRCSNCSSSSPLAALALSQLLPARRDPVRGVAAARMGGHPPTPARSTNTTATVASVTAAD